MKKLNIISLSITLLISIFPIISGLNVAMFIMCMTSHLTPNYGIIRELLHQNHSVVCIVNEECHDKLAKFGVDLVHNNGMSPKIAEKLESMRFVTKVQTMFNLQSTVHQDVLDYFENNRVDVILSSVVVLSSNHIADKFNIPLLMHTHTLGFIL